MNKYRTKDMPLASYLLCEEIPLVDCEKQSNGTSIFVFEETPKLLDHVEKYFSFKALVNPILFSNATKNLKSIMYRDN